MKKIYTLILVVLLSLPMLAQAPQKMNYQAVVRNANGQLIVNTTVGIRISILQGSDIGTAQYVELHTTATNANGLVTIAIGTGSPILNSFSEINWSNGPFFVKTETDPAGGTNFSIVGTSELMSVPFALFSANGGGSGSANINGTTNRIIKFTSSTAGGNSQLFDDGTNVGIGTTTPTKKLEVSGDALINGVTVGRGNGNISSNTAIGNSALFSNTTGFDNTANGDSALFSNTTGYANTAYGYKSLYSNISAASNTAYGNFSLYSLTSGGGNVANGSRTLRDNTTGYYNTANGFGALQRNTTGYSNTANGDAALTFNTTGYQNTADGDASLLTNTTGINNTALGYLADVSAGDLTNATAIGANATVGESNSLVLGSINGVNGATSDVNVGIGTTTPEAKLDIIGSVKISDGTQGQGKILTSDENGVASWVTKTKSGLSLQNVPNGVIVTGSYYTSCYGNNVVFNILTLNGHLYLQQNEQSAAGVTIFSGSGTDTLSFSDGCNGACGSITYTGGNITGNNFNDGVILNLSANY